MQISIMEISMSLNGNLGLSWGITQPTEKNKTKHTYKIVKCQFCFLGSGKQFSPSILLLIQFFTVTKLARE